jgi:hypothetical protein
MICIFLSQGYLLLQGQVIEGRVYDRETREAIEFAAIYFDGSLTGTTTDQGGHFILDISKYPNRPLTFSAVGYYSYKHQDITTGEPNIILLEPKRYEIEELTVSAKSLVRERRANLRLFTRELLGSSWNAHRCIITNEEAVTFNYGGDRDTLKAYALKPIVIQNRALGYQITYYMDQFHHDRNTGTTSFIGSIIYREDLATYSSIRSCERKRSITYKGSVLQLFRALWANDLETTAFKIENSIGTELGCGDLVIQDEMGNKYLSYGESLEVFYFTSWSQLEFLKERIPFEQNGFYDPSCARWRGRIARQRVADWLPCEYVPE